MFILLTLEEVKNNLRIDIDDDNAYLTGLIEASKMYILGSIEPRAGIENDSRFSVLQFMIIALWYENRVPATSAYQQQVPFTITAMIHQLRGVAEDGTDTNPTP